MIAVFPTDHVYREALRTEGENIDKHDLREDATSVMITKRRVRVQ